MADATIRYPVAIRQTITTGNHFGGVNPAAGPTLADTTYKFAASDTGGLFDPTNATWYAFDERSELYLVGVELVLAGQNTWSVSKEDVDGNAVVLWSGTTETDIVKGLEDRLVLLWGDTIKVATAGGAPTGLLATIKLAATLPCEV